MDHVSIRARMKDNRNQVSLEIKATPGCGNLELLTGAFYEPRFVNVLMQFLVSSFEKSARKVGHHYGVGADERSDNYTSIDLEWWSAGLPSFNCVRTFSKNRLGLFRVS